jgi:broad specificity phosphatase PhoE
MSVTSRQISQTAFFRGLLLFFGFLALVISTAIFAEPASAGKNGALQGTTILIIRHAEKPDDGSGLSPEGQARANAYVNYFKSFKIDGQPLKLTTLFAAADSKESHRPRLTLEPLSKALGLTIDCRFKNKKFRELADEIQSKFHGKTILIAWHHGEIPALLQALGADPNQIIPHAKWPGDVYGWLIQLRYDPEGHLIETKAINENLLPDDANKQPLHS